MALRLGSALGGGMGKSGGTCGAVTGAVMLAGLVSGPEDSNSSISNSAAYSIAAEFIDAFSSNSGSTICRDLLGFSIGDYNGSDRDEIIEGRCPDLVRKASEIIESIILKDSANDRKET